MAELIYTYAEQATGLTCSAPSVSGFSYARDNWAGKCFIWVRIYATEGSSRI